MPERTQRTPAGEEIPVPSREAVFRDLEKVARASRDDQAAEDHADDDGMAAARNDSDARRSGAQEQ